VKRRKILLLIVLAIIGGYLVFTWVTIFSANYVARWQHYVAVLLFAIVLFFYFRNFKLALLSTGIFLLIGMLGGLSLTPDVSKSYIRIGPLTSPDFNELCLGLFVLNAIMNASALIDLYLDYQERKQKIKN